MSVCLCKIGRKDGSKDVLSLNGGNPAVGGDWWPVRREEGDVQVGKGGRRTEERMRERERRDGE